MGEPGLIGPPGLDGTPGASGKIGAPGSDGEDLLLDPTPDLPCSICPAGPPGLRGPQGERGRSGIPGTVGLPGLLFNEVAENHWLSTASLSTAVNKPVRLK